MVVKDSFGSTKDGKETFLFTITNNVGNSVSVSNYGAVIQKILIADKNGNKKDVVLGYDTVTGYEEGGDFFGSIIGPNGNRIANAQFTIDGTTYQLVKNNGKNNLHSDGKLGYHKRVWDAICGENTVEFTLHALDKDMGFPGNKDIKVTYSFDDENALRIDYFVTTDMKTLINMTNHCYFNLEGHNSGEIVKHQVQIKASNYTPVYEDLIPNGEIVSVKGTPMDFLEKKELSKDIDSEFEQIRIGKGFDHNFVFDAHELLESYVAKAWAPVSEITMEVYTDMPGVQFYSGNCLNNAKGKGGAVYPRRGGFCMETQAFPDSINQKGFSDVLYDVDKPFKTTTIYKFC